MNNQNHQNLMLLTSSDTKRTLVHLFLFTNSANRENWFQHVRREYKTAINFVCITTLVYTVVDFKSHYSKIKRCKMDISNIYFKKRKF